MFELPEAKRIRRDEILSPSSSIGSSPETVPVVDDEDARARLGRILAFDTFTPDTNHIGKGRRNANANDDTVTAAAVAHDNRDDQDDNDEQEFEFRLFSTAPNKKSADAATVNANTSAEKDVTNKRIDARAEADDGIKTQKLKIRLRSPTPNDNNNALSLEDGRFVVPFRGWDYYFTTPELMNISPARDGTRSLEMEEVGSKRKQFESIAVTGGEVLHWAQTAKTPGCHLPWRVMHLKQEHSRVRGAVGIVEDQEKIKSKKPGKKRRIILRTRAAALAAAAATANMTEAEKRNKKNREKKVRKRQRERERKAALAASTGGAVVPDVEHASVGDSSD
ncbi:hypothetical protein UA08_08373 [Talaromyces atroroseus]|uniref:Uncharacterized protein n=1 Tax=Talaromyces atroroseus TaxID=1441469 RepID=A0A1Q5Q7Y6_TALAT|nr:hypothetical protein UA08_08373 [Talaromyces atroroseus]OKL56340.1 hypothetical protein UA08_08373 [Talaromyces atroroseus]